MAPYKLSVSLKGHEDDVRGVAFLSPDAIVSVSRDHTVRLWRSKGDPTALEFDDHVNTIGHAFINAVAIIKPTPEHPKGLIVSGGQDTIIEVREPETDPTSDPQYLLLGHSHNVCSLDTFGSVIISGSWDGTARVWKDGNTVCVFEGHEHAVWAVLAVSETEFITGGADKTIRLWKDGKLLSVLRGHTDVVRGLCRLPNGLFASCSNDATIRVWSADGEELQQLHGHTNYIYSISALPTGEIVSSGEDRTVRVWQNGDCIQTITHPAISVWGAAFCEETGDIVTGASDNMVRVFSRDEKRWASEEALKAYDDSVAGSSIPSNQVGELKNEDISGPEALERPGGKDGQVIVVKSGENLEAYVWSSQTQNWTKMGTVVDSGSKQKRVFDGKEYDFVFDVDIQEGAPPLKLPYNASENPFDAARRFLENNELPMSYLDTVGKFIVDNTKGVALGPTTDSAYTPWGGDSRYKPGDAAPSKPKNIPQTAYLSITTANLLPPEKKIKEINQDLIATGDKEKSLNPDELEDLSRLCRFLESTVASGKPATKPGPVAEGGLELVLKLVTVWPVTSRIPGLDLLRMLAATSPVVATYGAGGPGLVEVLKASGSVDKARPNHVMLITRTFVNLFQTEEGRRYLNAHFEEILELVTGAAAGTENKNLKIAQITMLLNYAVLFRAEKSEENALNSLEAVCRIVRTETEPETLFRALVTLGTLLSIGPDVTSAANLVYSAKQSAAGAAGRVKDQRIADVAQEVAALL